MKFKFKLEKVLVHRKILENIAQKDFQEAQAACNLQIDVLNRLKLEKSDARKKAFSDQSQTGGQVLESLKQVHDFIQLQDIRIENQIKTIAECEKLVEARREVLRQKAMDTKIIEKLKEKKKQQYLEEERIGEQKELDDNSSMRFDLIRKLKNL